MLRNLNSVNIDFEFFVNADYSVHKGSCIKHQVREMQDIYEKYGDFPNAIPVLWTLTKLKKFGIIDFSSPNSKLFSISNFVAWSSRNKGNEIFKNIDISFNELFIFGYVL